MMKYILSLSIIYLLLTNSILGQAIENSEWQKIIPSNELPSNVKSQRANNNLDLAFFSGKYYLAFRTAPSHFASKKTKLYVLRTNNFNDWEFENEVFFGTDLREPRFYQRNDTLFMMFMKLGSKVTKFQPQGVFVSYLNTKTNKWSPVSEVKIPLGYVPWRIIHHKDIFYLSTYDGINEYDVNQPSEFRIFTSTDGLNWNKISDKPQIQHERAIAEIEFIFDDQEDIWGIARLEFDGSYIVHAKKGDYTNFEFWYSPHKFDSPLLFSHKGNIYLVARRNLKGPLVRKKGKHKSNLVKYSLTKKTTSIYLLDTQNKSIKLIKDFNATGDNAFPAISIKNNNEYYLLNYSSDINKRRKNWIIGQLGKTYIYKSILKINNLPKEYKEIYQFQ